MKKDVRVRFAPSPTGPLHIGGVRTALYNYLFARNHGGSFILRIEDTDQSRFVNGAENYILQALEWCGISPDEGPGIGGDFGPYRQSERKETYRAYSEQLIKTGHAYYAFDTPEKLNKLRQEAEQNKSVFQYNAVTRNQLENSITLPKADVDNLLANGANYVIRLKVPEDETITITDIIRGEVQVHTSEIDDKILMKSDGLPTYHLANIVDDHLMEITHVIRGEEWLPSAPLHVLLYEYLGWNAPQFAHLPLLLKPDGKGKLSKRDGLKGGFPVFPLDWTDPATEETLSGFKESGYLSAAFVNFLALLGWNPGTEQEIFTLSELEKHFDLSRVNKAGARFDIQKAQWFNQQFIKNIDSSVLSGFLQSDLEKNGINVSSDTIYAVAEAMRERIIFPDDLWKNGKFFFEAPKDYDEKAVRKKWTKENVEILQAYSNALAKEKSVTPESAKGTFENVLGLYDAGMGQVMQPLRVALTGGSGGPDLMETISILGPEESSKRIDTAIQVLKGREK